MSETILTTLGAILVYLFGRWQGEHQLLYQRRAEVIDELFDRFEDVDQQFATLFNPLGGGDPEDAKQAAKDFNDLQRHYRQNSIWLPLRVSEQVSDFLARYREPLNEFTIARIRQEHDPQSGYFEKWDQVWTAFQKDSPEIRQILETEFRAALGSWRAKLAILSEYVSNSRQNPRPSLNAHSPGPAGQDHERG
jgi:hypothetical protein